MIQVYAITASENFKISEVTSGIEIDGKYYALSGIFTVKLASADGIHRADENYEVTITDSDVTVEATNIYIQLDADHTTYTNTENNISVIGSSGDDSITNTAVKVSINADDGRKWFCVSKLEYGGRETRRRHDNLR